MQGARVSRDLTTDRTGIRILDGLSAMHAARSLDAVAEALVRTAMDIVPCDHSGYSEADPHFGRTRFLSSDPEIDRLTAQRLPVWNAYMTAHPLVAARRKRPDLEVLRLSDVTSLSDFYRTGLYNDLYREVATRHQIVLHLGLDPGARRTGPGAFPLVLGVPLNRSGQDFSDAEVAALTLLQRMARPVLHQRRALHMMDLMDLAHLTPEVQRLLMGHGLTDRQADVAFWMLKGKSNTDIGTILGIGPDTVRHHSMAIFRRLGTDGRLALQRTVVRAILGAG